MKSFIRGRAASVFQTRSYLSRIARQRAICLGAAAVAATAVLSPAQAHASTITLGAIETVNSVGPSSTLGTDGYYFYDVLQNGTSTTSLASQPTYVSSITANPGANMTYANGISYSTITIASSTYNSGVIFKGSAGATVYTAATITLSGAVPSDIQLGFLEDNSINTANDAEVIVSDTQGGTPVMTIDPHSVKQTNNFYLVDIMGASDGDVISIGTKQVSGSAALGGITFDTIGVPEPASLGLLMAAGVGVLARRRRARQ